MSQSGEEFFSGMCSDHRSQESSSGSSGMGSFVDASKEFEDDDFVDLAEDFLEQKTEISGETHATNCSVLVERSEFVSGEILDTDVREQNTHNDGVPFLVTDEEPAITTTSIIPEDNILHFLSQSQSVDECKSGRNEGGLILENNSTQIYEVENPVAKMKCKMEEQKENNSSLRTNYHCKTEEDTKLMNIEEDRSNYERTESLKSSTQPSVSFQKTMREGKNQLIIMKQTSETMIKEFAEGKIDIPKMISENYEDEYTSKRVPSKTFNFIPPAKGLSGNYVDLGRLITIGVLGLTCGVLSSIFTEVTCNFASIEKSFGYSGITSSYMSFGLTKFSSMDSVFTGKKFCVPYHNNYYDMNGPSFARHAGELAIISGVCTMLILWYYIFTKRTTEICWKIGIYTSALASLFQISTYHFFFSGVCKDDTCLIGAGSIVSAIATLSYAVVAFGMIHNSPVRYMITVDKQGLLKNELNPDLV